MYFKTVWAKPIVLNSNVKIKAMANFIISFFVKVLYNRTTNWTEAAIRLNWRLILLLHLKSYSILIYKTKPAIGGFCISYDELSDKIERKGKKGNNKR